MPDVRTLHRGCGGLLLAALLALLPSTPAAAAPRRTRSPSRATAPAAPAAPAETPAAPAEASSPAAGSQAPAPALAARVEPPAPVRRAPEASSRSSAPREGEGLKWDRLGVALDLYTEGSQMNGEYSVAGSRPVSEAFNYGAGLASGSLYLMAQPLERVRVGPGVRILGTYGGGGGNAYRFGFLSELFALGEYAHPAFERFELVLGARAGVSVLVPTDEFAAEIRSEQQAGSGTWSTPRLGWLAAGSVGARRRMTENLSLRADFQGQLGALFLFATNETVRDVAGDPSLAVRYQKSWRADMRRLGFSLGAELTF
jgi:hypothetical protein